MTDKQFKHIQERVGKQSSKLKQGTLHMKGSVRFGKPDSTGKRKALYKRFTLEGPNGIKIYVKVDFGGADYDC